MKTIIKKIISFLFSITFFCSPLASTSEALLTAQWKPTKITYEASGFAAVLGLLFAGYQFLEHHGTTPMSQQTILKNIKAISQVVGVSAAAGMVPGYMIDVYYHNKIVHQLFKPHSSSLWAAALVGIVSSGLEFYQRALDKKNYKYESVIKATALSLVITYILGICLYNIKHFSTTPLFKSSREKYSFLHENPIIQIVDDLIEHHREWSVDEWLAFWNSSDSLDLIKDYKKNGGGELLAQKCINLLSEMHELKQTLLLWRQSDEVTLQSINEIKMIEEWVLKTEFIFSMFIFQINS